MLEASIKKVKKQQLHDFQNKLPSVLSVSYLFSLAGPSVLKPKKSLGQNFLRDENILRKTVESLHLSDDDVIVEIGPGQGALTRHLVLQPITLVGIELDERAIILLRQTIDEKAIFIHADVLDVSLRKISEKCQKKLRVVGNIPYYLTSEILFWILDAREVVQDATLMMQVEVARRLAAPPKNKEYGILSVFTQFYADCEILFKVSRNCFYPKPDVDSALVHLNIKNQLPQHDEKLFRSIVRATFGKRRKTLRNGLRSLGLENVVLDRIEFDLKKRPEDLCVDEFLYLAESIRKITNQ